MRRCPLIFSIFLGTKPISKGKAKEEDTEFMFQEGKLVIKDFEEPSSQITGK